MSFGRRVQQRRHELGLSQRALAEKAGIRHATLSAIESARQKETSIGVARRLAYALGVTLDWLIGPYVESEESELAPALAL